MILGILFGNAQETTTDTLKKAVDTLVLPPTAAPFQDSILRIINLNPYFTVQVDSVLMYDLQINKPAENFYWFMKNAPVGVKIDRNSGLLYFKAEKSYFKSGKLKFDLPYTVEVGVQNLRDPKEKYESSFTIMFYSTEVVVSKLKPTVGNILLLEEGDSIKFRVQCEEGSFPVEQITIVTNEPISNFKSVNKCNDEFSWMVPYDFIRDNDTARKTLVLQFIATDKFRNRDTSTVKLIIKPGINYIQKNLEHQQVASEMKKYVTNLKLTFYVISTNIKNNKKTRTGFDITGSTTAFMGTLLSTSGTSTGAKNAGKVLPSVGLSLVPVKEAVSPNKVQEQNTASQVRATIKRLDYMLTENMLIGDKDPDILPKTKKLREELKQAQLQLVKTKKLREELKQAQLQLVDLPLVEFDPRFSQEDAEKYFNNPKVNKKYKLKVN
ncbi:MAG: hypothetical protein EBS95_02535 [Chitinophagia bacterium]|nr:hypothetical protein [Chitinophagia bacterium]